MLYTFVKHTKECTFIEGCKFVRDIFQTSDDEKAERLRKSATFDRTVWELEAIDANPPDEAQPPNPFIRVEPPETPEPPVKPIKAAPNPTKPAPKKPKAKKKK